MPNLYIIAGPNGAGKTTASFTILPELLNVREFVNADEIAKGLSPFQPETVSLEAGRIMLSRIDDLITQKVDFAFETTLASRSFASLAKNATAEGYKIHLVFFWLDSFELAIARVQQRVLEGGHNIPVDIIERRYKAGISNFMTLYKNIVDLWIVLDNSNVEPALVAEGGKNIEDIIHNQDIWQKMN